VGEADPTGRRREHLGAVGGQLPAAGDEIGVQVGLGHVGDSESLRFGGCQVAAWVAFRINHQRPAAAELHQI
jgi:hypothetical protein